MTLLTKLNKTSPTLSDLHVPSVEWDWDAVHDALIKEMGRRGMEHVEKTDLRNLTESQIHRAFTVLADNLFALGYLQRSERIALSNTIGDALDAFGRVFEEKLEAGEFGNPDVSKDDILSLIGGAKEMLKAEPISKPYTMETLPDRVKAMPKGAQRIWLGAFNSASEKYEDESRAFAIAQGAVNQKYEEVDGRWRLKKSDEMVVPIVKYDDFKGLVYGVVLEPESVDSQGDTISPEEIELSAHAFMRKGHRLDLQHREDIQDDEAQVVESYIAQEDFGGVKKGSWVMAVQLKTEELKKGAREGDIAFYSIKGRGVRQAVGDEDIIKTKGFLSVLNKGGPGSGHHGHKGTPGSRGGSAPGTGKGSGRGSSDPLAEGIWTSAEQERANRTERERRQRDEDDYQQWKGDYEAGAVTLNTDMRGMMEMTGKDIMRELGEKEGQGFPSDDVRTIKVENRIFKVWRTYSGRRANRKWNVNLTTRNNTRQKLPDGSPIVRLARWGNATHFRGLDIKKFKEFKEV